MQFCDNVLLLDEGEILEAGRHEELMNGKGRYAQLISNYQLEQSTVRWMPFCSTPHLQFYHCLMCYYVQHFVSLSLCVCSKATTTTADIPLYCWDLKIVV